jgi:hypothetical protein
MLAKGVERKLGTISQQSCVNLTYLEGTMKVNKHVFAKKMLMDFKKSVLSTALISALGLTGAMALTPSTASAVAIADGKYQAIINVTPIVGGVPQFGDDGAWSSSLSFGLSSPSATSQKMTDNSTTISTPNGTRGSSMLGKGAGSFNINVSGGSFGASNFQVDAIPGTFLGTFVQYGTIAGGTVTGTGGMTLDVTGRLAAVAFGFPQPFDARWNVDDYAVPGATLYRQFTTGASGNIDTAGNSTTAGFLNNGAITGAEAVSLGDINGDGRTDYRIILVSAGHWGTDWGPFVGASYLETWNINLVSMIPIPTITLLAPDSGQVGDFIVIYGADFCAAKPGLNLCQTRTQAIVQVGSVFKAAAYVSPSFITFYVPNGAATAPIKVIVPDGLATGPTFTVLP